MVVGIMEVAAAAVTTRGASKQQISKRNELGVERNPFIVKATTMAPNGPINPLIYICRAIQVLG